MHANSRGEYQQIYSGRKFYALDPRPEDVSFVDIAQSLPHVNRFGGHSIRPYSVAQHSINVARIAGNLARAKSDNVEYIRGVALAGLLHDAGESLVGDLVTPVKKQISQYREIEHKILNVIFKKFGVIYKAEDLPQEVKRADMIALATERLYLVAELKDSWNLPENPEVLTASDIAKLPFHPANIRAISEVREGFIQKFLELSP